MSKRRFKSKSDLEETWLEFKKHCDNKKVQTEIVNTKDLIVEEVEFRRPVTYTIEGFCIFAKISRQAFYADYAGRDKYKDIVDRMKEECEVDQREKFEQGILNPKLAGMWMSKYDGYSQKIDQNVDAKNTVSVTFENQDLEDWSV